MRFQPSLRHSAASFFALFLAVSCGSSKVAEKGVKGVSANVTLTWANREKDVNKTGGGYRIYHSTTSANFSLTGLTPVDLPYVSGATAPRTYTFTLLPPGTHYFKIVAYSALGGGQTSEATQVSYTIP